MDEFGIGGSFLPRNNYNPFAGGYSGLNPTATSSNSNTTSSSSGSGGGTDWGGFFANALNRSLDFVGGLASIDLFGRAQDAGIGSVNNQATRAAQAAQAAQAAELARLNAEKSSSKLPKWAIPAGIGALVLLVILTRQS